MNKKFIGTLKRLNHVACIKCNGMQVGIARQVFRDKTEHVYARCYRCQKSWYLSKNMINDLSKLDIIITENQLKRDEALKQTLFDMAFGSIVE